MIKTSDIASTTIPEATEEIISCYGLTPDIAEAAATHIVTTDTDWVGDDSTPPTINPPYLIEFGHQYHGHTFVARYSTTDTVKESIAFLERVFSDVIVLKIEIAPPKGGQQ